MTRVTIPDHGTLSRYHIHACRCDTCRAHATAYAKRATLLALAGQWQPLTDAEPVRRHLAMLAEFGIGARRAARLAGVSEGCVDRLLYAIAGRPASRRIRTDTARRLLAVRPTLDNCAPGAKIDPTGARRRIQALVARGFPQTFLAARLGMESSNLSKIMHKGRVAVATARAVAGLYDQLWDADPADHGIAKHGISYARRIAADRGWLPPLAWDDDAMDDPAAKPDLGETTTRQAALLEDLEWITRTTDADLATAAQRLGISRDYLDKIRERAATAA